MCVPIARKLDRLPKYIVDEAGRPVARSRAFTALCEKLLVLVYVLIPNGRLN